jgi:hypothetical protein
VTISPARARIPGRWVGEVVTLTGFGFVSYQLTVDVSGNASAISGPFVIPPGSAAGPGLHGTFMATMDGTRVLTFTMTLDSGQCPEDAPSLDTVSATTGSFVNGINLNRFDTFRDPRVDAADWVHGAFLCRPDANGPFLYLVQPVEVVLQGPFP